MASKKLKFGGGLALLALCLQLTLSFGHIHAEDGQNKDVAVTNLPADPIETETAPADSHHDGDHDEFCQICAIMHMAGTSLLPPGPQVTLPAEIFSVVLIAIGATPLPPLALPFFQARAPPRH